MIAPAPGLLERVQEARAIELSIASARAGRGGFVLVHGPSGIGKTVLLGAARNDAGSAGMRVLTARAIDLERNLAFGVVRQLFEPVIFGSETKQVGDLLRGAAQPAAEVLCPPMQPRQVTDVSFGILHGLYWLTSDLSGRWPLAIFVDDLQWCDVPSLRFLAYLLPRVVDLPVLIVAALRSGETPADRHLVDHIYTDPAVNVLRPLPLTADASAQLVRATESAKADDSVCAAIYDASRGNPLLVRELTRIALMEGSFDAGGDDLTARLAELAPRAVGARVAMRMDRFGHPAHTLARAISILGEASLIQAPTWRG